ncbi:hypothetical protein KIPB_012903, partial [Kipferlia bialata]
LDLLSSLPMTMSVMPTTMHPGTIVSDGVTSTAAAAVSVLKSWLEDYTFTDTDGTVRSASISATLLAEASKTESVVESMS